MEIIRTGSLRRISYERTQDVHIVLAFQGIYGVGELPPCFSPRMESLNTAGVIGQKTAYQWYANGCRSLDNVREGKFGVSLSTAQQIGLKFYDGMLYSDTRIRGRATH
jgi:DNA polymerase lambda